MAPNQDEALIRIHGNDLSHHPHGRLLRRLLPLIFALGLAIFRRPLSAALLEEATTCWGDR
jgi:hypothetical protein